MTNKNALFISLSSLSMDLKRVALGFHRGSDAMAKRFLEEALKRKEEIHTSEVKPYVADILRNIEKLSSQGSQQAAENALMYSTLIQNASLNL